MSGYPYQTLNHNASISATIDGEDSDIVVIEVFVGDLVTVRAPMWLEDFTEMANSIIKKEER